MIIDTSVLVAILEGEPEADAFVAAMQSAARCAISAVSVLEAGMVLEARRGPLARGTLDDLIRRCHISALPFNTPQLELARTAFSSSGKGRHPAKLNFGDCVSYALARYTGEPLLFKGDHFSRTDIRPA